MEEQFRKNPFSLAVLDAEKAYAFFAHGEEKRIPRLIRSQRVPFVSPAPAVFGYIFDRLEPFGGDVFEYIRRNVFSDPGGGISFARMVDNLFKVVSINFRPSAIGPCRPDEQERNTAQKRLAERPLIKFFHHYPLSPEKQKKVLPQAQPGTCKTPPGKRQNPSLGIRIARSGIKTLQVLVATIKAVFSIGLIDTTAVQGKMQGLFNASSVSSHLFSAGSQKVASKLRKQGIYRKIKNNQEISRNNHNPQKTSISTQKPTKAPVAQLDRVPDFEDEYRFRNYLSNKELRYRGSHLHTIRQKEASHENAGQAI